MGNCGSLGKSVANAGEKEVGVTLTNPPPPGGESEEIKAAKAAHETAKNKHEAAEAAHVAASADQVDTEKKMNEMKADAAEKGRAQEGAPDDLEKARVAAAALKDHEAAVEAHAVATRAAVETEAAVSTAKAEKDATSKALDEANKKANGEANRGEARNEGTGASRGKAEDEEKEEGKDWKLEDEVIITQEGDDKGKPGKIVGIDPSGLLKVKYKKADGDEDERDFQPGELKPPGAKEGGGRGGGRRRTKRKKPRKKRRTRKFKRRRRRATRRKFRRNKTTKR